VTIQQKLVVIPSQPGVNRPVFQTNLVLHKYGLFPSRVLEVSLLGFRVLDQLQLDTD